MKPYSPVMAAVWAAVWAACLSPRPVFADAAATKAPIPASKPAPSAKTADAPHALEALIKKGDQAKKDVDQAVQALVLDPKKKYAADDVRASAEDATLIAAEVGKWVKASPLSAATLYFVLASKDPAPDWIKNDPTASKLFTPGQYDLPACLADRLSTPPGSQVGLIQQAGLAASLGNFLQAAGLDAQKVLLDCGHKRQIENSIAANDQGTNPAPMSPQYGNGNGGGNVLQNAPASSFQNLYVDGAVVANVYRDKQDGYRKLSIKEYTVKDANGQLVSKIGVVDITDPAHIYAPAFVPINTGKTTISVYGGQDSGAPITRNYELTVGADGTITLARPKTQDGQGSAAKFSPSELATLRANQVATQGGQVSIDGKSYYVLGQGGATGSYLFFDKSLIDARGNGGNPLLLRPAAIADGVEKVDADGLSVPASGKKPDMGTFYNSATGAQDPYHLQFNQASGQWEVKPGPGDPPPAPPSSSTDTAHMNAAALTGGKAGGGNGGPSTASGQCGAAACGDFTDSYTGRDGNADFDAADLARVHLMKSKTEANTFYLVFAKGLVKTHGQAPADSPLVFGPNVLPGLTGARGFEDQIAFEQAKGQDVTVSYYPISAILAQYNDGKTFAPAQYDTGNNVISGAPDIDVAIDIVATYSQGITDAQGKAVAYQAAAQAIAANFKKIEAQLGDGGYMVSGSLDGKQTSGTLRVMPDDKSKPFFEIWPVEKTVPRDATSSGTGTGTAFEMADVSALSGDHSFEPGFKQADDAKNPNAALYEVDDGSWSVVFRMQREDADSKTTHLVRSANIPLQGDIAQWMKDGGVQLQGLQAAAPVPINNSKIVFFGDATKGAYVVYRDAVPSPDNSNIKNAKKNCAGPVIWRGMTLAEAQAVCNQGHL
ncbi:MAG: hypothetical protein HKL90_05900 [Elusimicrobia bacterium]|nr:hypothetical protein [Elusimicrobiota bacterium]